MIEKATIVTSLPSLSIFDLPIGIVKSLSWGQKNFDHTKLHFLRILRDPGSLIAVFNNPLASSLDQGDITFNPGMCEYQLA